MSTPFPPPPANDKPKRKLWPWFLGGCLVLVLIGVAAFIGVGYLGAKWMGAAAKETLAGIPVVEENFGTVTDAGMDLMALGTTPGSMVFKITGEKGEGRLSIQVNPATQEFESATLTLPNGEVHDIDASVLEKLKALQQGRLPQG